MAILYSKPHTTNTVTGIPTATTTSISDLALRAIITARHTNKLQRIALMNISSLLKDAFTKPILINVLATLSATGKVNITSINAPKKLLAHASIKFNNIVTG